MPPRPLIEASLRREAHLAAEEALALVRAIVGKLSGAAKTWRTADRRRAPLARLTAEDLLHRSIRLPSGSAPARVHTIRLADGAGLDGSRFALVLRVRESPPQPRRGGDAQMPGIELSWTAPIAGYEAMRNLISAVVDTAGADEAMLGPTFDVHPRLSALTLVGSRPAPPPPAGIRLTQVHGRCWLECRAALEEPAAPATALLIAKAAEWLVQRPAENLTSASSPRALQTPSYLQSAAPRTAEGRAEEPNDATAAMPPSDEIRRLAAAAEPRVAMARAASTIATRSPAPRAGGSSADSPRDPFDQTALAPSPEEIRRLIAGVTPFRSSGVAGPPMDVDDYAVLHSLRMVRGEAHESVRARYGTDSREERRALDRGMEQHFATHPEDRARFEERCKHFIVFLFKRRR